MIQKLSLPSDRFQDSEMSGFKLKNFIFGKNGTGKSSIAKAIKEQYGNQYDIRIFQGYEKIITEKGGLRSISLGTVNAELQPQIDEQEKVIKNLEMELTLQNTEDKNLYIKQENQKRIVNEVETDIESFCSASARKLKTDFANLVSPNYNKNNFKADLKKMKPVSDFEKKEAEKQFGQSVINIIAPFVYYSEPIDRLDRFLEPVNMILEMELVEQAVLSFESANERLWVKDGICLHNEREYCLFCGSKIEETRKMELNSYFNETVNGFSQEISNLIADIELALDKIEKLPLIDGNQFIEVYKDNVNALNVRLVNVKSEAETYLKLLKMKLENRQKNLFLSMEPIKMVFQDEFKDFNKEYLALYNLNKKSNDNLATIKSEAKKVLLDYLIQGFCKENNYSKKQEELIRAGSCLKVIREEFKNKKDDLNKAREKLREFKLKTVDEELAAISINQSMKGLGNQSFTLVKEDSGEERGRYIIHDYQGNERSIETLSTGEKNIVAFLWFIYDLQNVREESSKKQILVFDDPMNSNDDTTQYLIISELQKLLHKPNYEQIFILTHNVHFYLNTRYKWWFGAKKNSYDKTTYHLVKVGVRSSIIAVNSEEEDIKTSYDALWDEVRWIYSNNGESEYLLNPIRRILETYKKFNCIEDLYKEYKEAEKLFHVNSHGIDDFEADLNGKSSPEIIQIFKQVFELHDAENHFKEHWEVND